MMTFALAFLTLSFAPQEDKEADKAAADALEKFQKAYKGSDEERKTAIVELAKIQHAKVVSKLGTILSGATPSPVRLAAVTALSGFTEQKKAATAALANAIPANAKEPALLSQIFEAIAKLQDPSAVPVLVRYFEDKDLSLAQNATFTTGKVGHPSGIDPLIALLARNEKAAKPPGAGIGVTANGTNPGQTGGIVVSGSSSNAQRDRAQALVSAANRALQELTKEQLNTADAWTAWWAKNKATFKK